MLCGRWYTLSCLLAVLSCTTACGDDATSGDGGPLVDIMESRPAAMPLPGETECVVTTAREPATSRDHVTPCTEIDYPVHPPTSGPHYDRWADFRVYTQPVPSGFLVHSMEHGAVVFNYDCPSGCPDVLAAFDAIMADHGIDPSCDGVDARFIVAPDPDLDTPIAVTAWEHLYTATCLDEESLRAFVEAHYGQGPEDLCGRGFDGEARSDWCG